MTLIPFLLQVILVLVYTQGLLELTGIPSIAIKLAIEGPLILLLLNLLTRPAIRLAPGWGFVLFFFLSSLASGMVSGDGIMSAVLYSRTLIYAYIIYWAVYATPLHNLDRSKLLRWIVWLWTFQIAITVLKLGVFGSRQEGIVGSITSTGGVAGTAFPLLVTAFAMTWFLLNDHSPKWLILTLASGLVGYASGKRAIYFYLPALYFVILAGYISKTRESMSLSRILVWVIVLTLGIPFFSYGIRHTGGITLNQEQAGASEQVRYAIDAARQYESITVDGQTGGRTATSRRVLDWLSSVDPSEALLGYGPGSLMGEKRAMKKVRFFYGMVGWAHDAVSIGIPGMLAQIGFYLLLWIRVIQKGKLHGAPQDWRALQWGTSLSFLVFFLLYFTYCDASALRGWFAFVHLAAVGLILSPVNSWLPIPPPALSPAQTQRAPTRLSASSRPPP